MTGCTCVDRQSWCGVRTPERWICSREKGHPGQHIACYSNSLEPTRHMVWIWPVMSAEQFMEEMEVILTTKGKQ
jgi:hypothetical protein